MNEAPSIYLVSNIMGKTLFAATSLEEAKHEVVALIILPYQIIGDWVEVAGSDRFYLEFDTPSGKPRPSAYIITKISVKPSAETFTLTTSPAEGVYLFAALASAASVAQRNMSSSDAAIAAIEKLRDNVLASLIAHGFAKPE